MNLKGIAINSLLHECSRMDTNDHVFLKIRVAFMSIRVAPQVNVVGCTTQTARFLLWKRAVAFSFLPYSSAAGGREKIQTLGAQGALLTNCDSGLHPLPWLCNRQ